MKATDILIFFDERQFRRPKAILNLLKGKTTGSSLFLALNYQMMNYIGFWKNIDGEAFLKEVKKAKQAGLLIENDGQYRLSSAGIDQKIKVGIPPKITPQLDLERAQALFLMAIQVVSEYSYENNRYLPISDDLKISSIVKQWFIELKYKFDGRMDLVQQIKQDLINILSQLDESLVTIFVNYWPSHLDSGLTVSQLATATNQSVFLIEYQIRLTLATICTSVLENQVSSLLNLVMPIYRTHILPDSIQETWSMIQRQLPIQTIAQSRHIKVNTVKEHVLMSAMLLDQVDYQQLLPDVLNEAIFTTDLSFNKAAEKYPNLTFFDFRLVQIRNLKETHHD